MSTLYERLKSLRADRDLPGRPIPAVRPGTVDRGAVTDAGGRRSPERPPLTEAQEAAKNRVRDQLAGDPGLQSVLQVIPPGPVEKKQVRDRVSALVETEAGLSPLEREAVLQNLLSEILGFGPLQPLLDDPEVTEIMVNSPADIYVERKGKIEPARTVFRDEKHLLQTIERMVIPLGRRVDEGSPMVDARLPDGSRVNVIIPPLAVRGRY